MLGRHSTVFVKRLGGLCAFFGARWRIGQITPLSNLEYSKDVQLNLIDKDTCHTITEPPFDIGPPFDKLIIAGSIFHQMP